MSRPVHPVALHPRGYPQTAEDRIREQDNYSPSSSPMYQGPLPTFRHRFNFATEAGDDQNLVQKLDENGVVKKTYHVRILAAVEHTDTKQIDDVELTNEEGQVKHKWMVRPSDESLTHLLFQEASLSTFLRTRLPCHPKMHHALFVTQALEEKVACLMEPCLRENVATLLIENGPDALPWTERMRLAMELTEEVVCLHAKGYSHLDLRPDHIGLIRKEGRLHPFLSHFETIEHNHEVEEDLWALGLILLLCYKGQTFFDSHDIKWTEVFNLTQDKKLQVYAAIRESLEIDRDPLSYHIGRLLSPEGGSRPAAHVLLELLKQWLETHTE